MSRAAPGGHHFRICQELTRILAGCFETSSQEPAMKVSHTDPVNHIDPSGNVLMATAAGKALEKASVNHIDPSGNARMAAVGEELRRLQEELRRQRREIRDVFTPMGRHA